MKFQSIYNCSGSNGKTKSVDDLDRRFEVPIDYEIFELCLKAAYSPHLMNAEEWQLYEQIIHDQNVHEIESSRKTLEEILGGNVKPCLPTSQI